MKNTERIIAILFVIYSLNGIYRIYSSYKDTTEYNNKFLSTIIDQDEKEHFTQTISALNDSAPDYFPIFENSFIFFAGLFLLLNRKTGWYLAFIYCIANILVTICSLWIWHSTRTLSTLVIIFLLLTLIAFLTSRHFRKKYSLIGRDWIFATLFSVAYIYIGATINDWFKN